MTWNLIENCQRCGASFEIVVWDLGHQESDSLTCEFCGAILKEWKKEPRSYSISMVLHKGSLRPKNGDLESFIGKKIELTKNEMKIEGTVKGQGESVVALAATEVGRPWLIVSENGDEVEIAPDGTWSVRIIQ